MTSPKEAETETPTGQLPSTTSGSEQHGAERAVRSEAGSDVQDGFDGEIEYAEIASERFAGVSADVVDLLERMESCYSLDTDLKSGQIPSTEAGELQDQLGCGEIEADIARTSQQHADEPKVEQLIQQMKQSFRRS
ncbi:MAG: hypothetical protein VXW65_05705 [Pseudomonadota bacterium]|nr:hypothetical protein [Pseudomonadota bacterium]